MRILLGFFLVVGTVTVCIGQNFIGEASLPPIRENGFYRIAIDPALNPYLNEDLSNVRIIGDDKREVPYLLQEQTRVLHTRQFREYKIIEKMQERRRSSVTLLNMDAEYGFTANK